MHFTKAWETVYVVGSGPYMWSGYEQMKENHWLQSSILSPCQRRDCLGKEVRYASDMVLKYSQKGDGDLLRSTTIKTSLIG